MLLTKYWEDFCVGDRFTTGSLTVTEAHMVQFAGLTGDYYPLHMDEEYAKKTVFGGRIVHGPLTFCLAVGLVGQTGVFGDSIVAFVGCDHLSLPAPVKPGDTITVNVEVESKKETSKPDKGITSMVYNVTNQHGTTVLKAKLNFLIKRKTKI